MQHVFKKREKTPLTPVMLTCRNYLTLHWACALILFQQPSGGCSLLSGSDPPARYRSLMLLVWLCRGQRRVGESVWPDDADRRPWGPRGWVLWVSSSTCFIVSEIKGENNDLHTTYQNQNLLHCQCTRCNKMTCLSMTYYNKMHFTSR